MSTCSPSREVASQPRFPSVGSELAMLVLRRQGRCEVSFQRHPCLSAEGARGRPINIKMISAPVSVVISPSSSLTTATPCRQPLRATRRNKMLHRRTAPRISGRVLVPQLLLLPHLPLSQLPAHAEPASQVPVGSPTVSHPFLSSSSAWSGPTAFLCRL